MLIRIITTVILIGLSFLFKEFLPIFITGILFIWAFSFSKFCFKLAKPILKLCNKHFPLDKTDINKLNQITSEKKEILLKQIGAFMSIVIILASGLFLVSFFLFQIPSNIDSLNPFKGIILVTMLVGLFLLSFTNMYFWILPIYANIIKNKVKLPAKVIKLYINNFNPHMEKKELEKLGSKSEISIYTKLTLFLIQIISIIASYFIF